MGEQITGVDLAIAKAQFEKTMAKDLHMTMQEIKEMEKNMTDADWIKIHRNQQKAAQNVVDKQFGTPIIEQPRSQATGQSSEHDRALATGDLMRVRSGAGYVEISTRGERTVVTNIDRKNDQQSVMSNIDVKNNQQNVRNIDMKYEQQNVKNVDVKNDQSNVVNFDVKNDQSRVQKTGERSRIPGL